MSERARACAALSLAMIVAAGTAAAHGSHFDPQSFRRVGTLANYLNNADIGDTTVAEIVAATRDGMTLVYTDSPGEQIGFVDIKDPSTPFPTGTLAMGGEPTSVDILGNKYALVAVNTSESFTNTSGKLAVVDMKTRAVVRAIDLGGQPDSIKISPDERYVAIAIENERDEEVVVGGVEGGLPQNPPGYLVIVDIKGSNPANWTRRDVALTGLAAYASEDPEPEFVDVNDRNEAVITLQENNHIAIVDLRSGKLTRHFPAGSVSLRGIDATEDGTIKLTDSLDDIPREPDAVAWVPGPFGTYTVATANEGDLVGGSRGFSLFSRFGHVLFDSGSELERIAVRHGHYPESRSENKGTEPEAVAYARYGKQDYLFVGSERGSFVAVYDLKFGLYPKFSQLLPAPLGPEGLLPIPSRGLLIASGEEDAPPLGVRSTLSIYKLESREPTYPQIVSGNDSAGNPIGWSALSGLVAVPHSGSQLLGVWDSYYDESRIFRIDAAQKPAKITGYMSIKGASRNYDPEGIALAPDNTIWVASEGNASDSLPNLLLQLDSAGHLIKEVGLPAQILACRKASASRGTLGSGFEGVAVLPASSDGGGYKLLVAQQRGWNYTTPECEELDDDAGGLNALNEPNFTRIWSYDTATGEWNHIAWQLAPLPADAAWVGLSEITRAPDGSYVVLERDNRTGNFAELKTLVRFTFGAAGDGRIVAAEKKTYDFLPKLTATNGWITDKPEGVAITGDGRTFVVTDNDGVEDWSGETTFLNLGRYRRLFNSD
jgi:DNA-binding beta-propeller fold protein YncE